MTSTVEGYSDVLYAVTDAVARVTINRPEKLNAFTPHTLEELARAIWRTGADSEVGVVVLTGTGADSTAHIREEQERFTILNQVDPGFFASGEQTEGSQVFLEKRRPDFSPWR